MKHGNISFEKIDDQLNIYKQRSIEELKKVEPKWACGKYVNKLYDGELHPKRNEYTIFLVKTSEIISNAEFAEVDINALFTGNSKNDFRITRLLYRWENNFFVDPPTLGLCSYENKKLSFSDGRHRTKLSYLLGYQKIPIAIANDKIQEFRSYIQLMSV